MPDTPRRLSEREREVINALLPSNDVDSVIFREQMDTLEVVGRCPCACPTVQFASPDKGGGGIRVIAEATVVGSHDSILLFATDENVLASLEYVSVDDRKPRVCPEAESLLVSPPR